MTEQRRAQLEAERSQALLTDEQKTLQGTIMDGILNIDSAHAAIERVRIAELAANPVMAAVGPAKKESGRGSGKRLAVRR
jgi:hypothetical protein